MGKLLFTSITGARPGARAESVLPEVLDTAPSLPQLDTFNAVCQVRSCSPSSREPLPGGVSRLRRRGRAPHPARWARVGVAANSHVFPPPVFVLHQVESGPKHL